MTANSVSSVVPALLFKARGVPLSYTKGRPHEQISAKTTDAALHHHQDGV